MNEIEERAKEYEQKKHCSYAPLLGDAYYDGATEQKAIDDAHLAEVVAQWKEEEKMWLKQESSGKELLYVVDKTTRRVKREMINKARKILEEKTNGGLGKIFLDDFEELMMEE